MGVNVNIIYRDAVRYYQVISLRKKINFDICTNPNDIRYAIVQITRLISKVIKGYSKAKRNIIDISLKKEYDHEHGYSPTLYLPFQVIFPHLVQSVLKHMLLSAVFKLTKFR